MDEVVKLVFPLMWIKNEKSPTFIYFILFFSSKGGPFCMNDEGLADNGQLGSLCNLNLNSQYHEPRVLMGMLNKKVCSLASWKIEGDRG